MSEASPNHRAAESVAPAIGHPAAEDASPLQGGKWIKLHLTPEQARYFLACSRIRDLAFTALMRRVVETIAEHKMVSAILDDDCKPERRKHERRARKNGAARAPANSPIT